MLAEEAVKELQILFSCYYVCFENVKLCPHCREILIITV